MEHQMEGWVAGGRSWSIRWKAMEHQMEGHGTSDGRMGGRHGPREEAKVKDPRLVARSMGQGQNRWSPPNAYAYAYGIDIYGQGIYRSPGQWAYSPWVVSEDLVGRSRKQSKFEKV